MNSAEYAKYIIDRAKNLEKFTISRVLPSGFRLHGTAPFDLQIKKGHIHCEVYAVSQQEADTMVDQYLQEHNDG